MKVCGRSDIGLVRDSNQDSFDYKIINDDMIWAVVCDGMGGTNGGGVASRLAVESIKTTMSEFYTQDIDFTCITDILKKAICEANYKIYELSQKESSLKNMGTTVVLLAVFQDNIYVAYVGDSRAYLINENEISQLTTDHSVVQTMVTNGDITQEEAKTHPQKNIITRALGISETVKIDCLKYIKKEKDSIIICTDGLTNHLEKEDILFYFKKNKNNNELVEELIRVANERGGNDNITVVLVGS